MVLAILIYSVDLCLRTRVPPSKVVASAEIQPRISAIIRSLSARICNITTPKKAAKKTLHLLLLQLLLRHLLLLRLLIRQFPLSRSFVYVYIDNPDVQAMFLRFPRLVGRAKSSLWCSSVGLYLTPRNDGFSYTDVSSPSPIDRPLLHLFPRRPRPSRAEVRPTPPQLFKSHLLRCVVTNRFDSSLLRAFEREYDRTAAALASRISRAVDDGSGNCTNA